MRIVGGIAAGLCVGACSLLTPLGDLQGDAGGSGDTGANGSIAFVQGRVVHDSNVNVASRTVTVSIPNVAAHDAIVVGVVGYQSGAPLTSITVTDDHGNTFVPAGPITSFDEWVNSSVATAFDVTGDNYIVSVDLEGTAIEASDVFVVEYSGITTNDAMSYGTGDATGADGIVAAPVKLTGASDLIVGLTYSDGTASVGSNFTKRFLGGNDVSLFEDRISTSAGTYGATATMGATGNYWVIVMAAFK